VAWWPESWRFGRAGPAATPASPASNLPADPPREVAGGDAGRPVDSWPGDAQPADIRPADPGWRAMAPLQRSITAIQPVAPLDRFTADLRSHQDPRFLAPLSHLRGPSGPAGQVEGLIRAGRPVQRVETSELAVRTDTSAPQRPRPERTVQGFTQPGVSAAPMITAAPADPPEAVVPVTHEEPVPPLDEVAEAPPVVAPTAGTEGSGPGVTTSPPAPSVQRSPEPQRAAEPQRPAELWQSAQPQGVDRPATSPELPPLVLRRLVSEPATGRTPRPADLPPVQPFPTPVLTLPASGLPEGGGPRVDPGAPEASLPEASSPEAAAPAASVQRESPVQHEAPGTRGPGRLRRVAGPGRAASGGRATARHARPPGRALHVGPDAARRGSGRPVVGAGGASLSHRGRPSTGAAVAPGRPGVRPPRRPAPPPATGRGPRPHREPYGVDTREHHGTQDGCLARTRSISCPGAHHRAGAGRCTSALLGAGPHQRRGRATAVSDDG